jgi:hypothetical protein
MAKNDPSSLTAAAEAKALKKLRWTSPGVAPSSYAGQAPLCSVERRRGRQLMVPEGPFMVKNDTSWRRINN